MTTGKDTQSPYATLVMLIVIERKQNSYALSTKEANVRFVVTNVVLGPYHSIITVINSSAFRGINSWTGTS